MPSAVSEGPQTDALSWFELADAMRRAHGDILDLLGFGPDECAYRVRAATRYWQLRDYGGPTTQQPVLIVAAPIKRPYIWDLTPATSAIRYLLQNRLHVYLLEWKSPSLDGGFAGLDIYGDRGIADCVGWISTANGKRPFVIGHSLGGSLAAVHAALNADNIHGLVLLGAPLCFQPRSSGFRDAVDILAPLLRTQANIVPGSAISQLSALASPETFIWSRLIDHAFSSLDIKAAEICLRVERWALDEVALPGLFVRQVVQWLYQEDQFCHGALRIRGRPAGPVAVTAPTLAVINTADMIAPRASVAPFLDRMPVGDVRLLEFTGEIGVGLQHVALLVGPRAQAEIWPAIVGWIGEHS